MDVPESKAYRRCRQRRIAVYNGKAVALETVLRIPSPVFTLALTVAILIATGPALAQQTDRSGGVAMPRDLQDQAGFSSNVDPGLYEVDDPAKYETDDPAILGAHMKLRQDPPVVPAAQTTAPAAQVQVQATPPDDSAAGSKKQTRSERRKEAKQHKQELGDLDNLPVMREIARLKWEAATSATGTDDTKKISLEKIFHETLDHSIPVQQAALQVKDAEHQAHDLHNFNLFNLLNPASLLDGAVMKKAAESNIQAARAHLLAVRQKALLDSARMQAALMRAFLSKYLAYEAIEQGRLELKAGQQHFIAGDNTRFDVTQTQMALIDRYNQYLSADNDYHTASITLASQIGTPSNETLIPEGYVLSDGNASVSPLSLLPEGLTLEMVQKTATTRPELQELGFRKASLEQLVKALSVADKQKKEAELKQLELEIDKAGDAARVMAEKAYSDYRLSGKSLDLARQQYALAAQMQHQLQISRDAGFSSSKDVLDGEVALARAKSALIASQVAYNLSQIQLVYEMGLLGEEVFKARPLTVPGNIL